MVKTATAKRLAEEEDISMWEAEYWLDADACLWEQVLALRKPPQGVPSPPNVPACHGKGSEYNCAIHHGHRQPLPQWDLLAEPTTVELFSPDSTCQDIEDMYWEIYQLCRMSRKGRSGEVTEEQIW